MTKTATEKELLIQSYKDAGDAAGAARKRQMDIAEVIYEKFVKPELEHLVGTCYRYSNSYGGDRRWWMFIKVMRIEDGSPVALIAQEPSPGHPVIKIETIPYYQGTRDIVAGENPALDDGYIPITPEEFEVGYRHIYRKFESV